MGRIDLKRIFGEGGNSFRVSASELTAAAAKISQAANDFLQTAGQVLAAAEALGSSWEGDSQVAFAAEQAKAVAWYRRMGEIVNSYVDMLNGAAKAYQQADTDVSSMINSK